MAGAYCKYCGSRCFVARQVIVAGELVWSGHMATCASGKEHDRRALGMDSDTAHNPVWDGCTCLNVCGKTVPLAAPAAPITQVQADAIRTVLWTIEHVPVGVHVTNIAYGPHIDIWPVGRPLTTKEEVTALRAFCAVTDLPVRWYPGVDAR